MQWPDTRFRNPRVLAIVIAELLIAGCGTTADAPGSAATLEPSGSETACIVDPPEEPTPCTMQYDPVCGCDDRTYGNACTARGAGVPRFTPGACPKENT